MPNESMKAWQLQDFGLEYLKQVRLPVPVPGPHQLLVRVGAVSLNYRDKMVADKRYLPDIMRLPLVPVSDAAGEVVATGAAVTRFKKGDRVMSHLYTRWTEGLYPAADVYLHGLGGPLNGGLAEYILLEEQAAVATPAGLTDEEAATLPIVATTVWSALVEQGRLQPGQTVLVQGTGGVSLFAIQLARALGAQVIATSSSDDKLEKVKALGAHHTINYKRTPEWHEEALALNNGKGVDHIVEVAGGSSLQRSIAAAAPGGQISIVGVLDDVQSQIPLTTVLFRAIRLQGVLVGSRAAFEAVAAAVGRHGIKPVIDTVYPFTDAIAAYTHLGKGAFGKIVIRVNG